MFDSTHDAILMIVAALYVLVGIARVTLNSPPHGIAPAGWFSAPFLIAALLSIAAVLI